VREPKASWTWLREIVPTMSNPVHRLNRSPRCSARGSLEARRSAGVNEVQCCEKKNGSSFPSQVWKPEERRYFRLP